MNKPFVVMLVVGLIFGTILASTWTTDNPNSLIPYFDEITPCKYTMEIERETIQGKYKISGTNPYLSTYNIKDIPGVTKAKSTGEYSLEFKIAKHFDVTETINQVITKLKNKHCHD